MNAVADSRWDVGHYERADIVEIWQKSYEIEKERYFIQCIDGWLPKDQLRLLDVGCGIGLHTALWSERGKDVTASDFSTQFRDYIERTYKFPFIWADVLNCSIREQYDICFCMAIATILMEEKPRFQTFETLARLVRPGSFLVLITASNQWPFRMVAGRSRLHSIDRRDLRKLKELGFEIQRRFHWSSSPKRLWRTASTRTTAKMIEWLGTRLGIGARKVIICRRRAT